MKEKTLYLYQCEICHTKYDDKAECEKCEKSHKAVSIDELEYDSYRLDCSGFPSSVKLSSDNGEAYWYVRTIKDVQEK